MEYLPKIAMILGILWYAANLADWLWNKFHPVKRLTFTDYKGNDVE